MKKYLAAITGLTAVISLTGCSYIEAEQEKALKKALENEPAYQTYISLEKEGLLDENGCYDNGFNEEAVAAIASVDNAWVSVTFADNPDFDIDYYLDKELTIPADNGCMLSPGDFIYASEPKIISQNTMFEFDRYRIYEWTDAGKRELSSEIYENNAIYHIPDNFSGTEIIIEPTGIYPDRYIRFGAYCMNIDGEQQTVNGLWTVNDIAYPVLYAELPSTEDYNVKFDYNEDEYFYVSASPSTHTYNDDTGIIEFHTASSEDKNHTYSAILDHYISAETGGKKDKIISALINGKTADISDGTLSKLRADDILTIETNKEYGIFCIQQSTGEPEILSDGSRRYSFNIRKTADNRLNFCIFKGSGNTIVQYYPKSINNGNVFVRLSDDRRYTLQSGNYINETAEVEIEISPNEGYYISELKDNETAVKKMKYSEYITDIDKLLSEYEIKKYVRVYLDTACDEGIVYFEINGQNCKSTSWVYLRQDDKLTINHVIETDNTGLFNNLFKNDKKTYSQKINISSGLENETITAEKYILYD